MVVIRTKRDLKAHIKKYLTPFCSTHHVLEDEELKALTQEFSEASTVFSQPLPLVDTVVNECVHAALLAFLARQQVSQDIIQRVVQLKPAGGSSPTPAATTHTEDTGKAKNQSSSSSHGGLADQPEANSEKTPPAGAASSSIFSFSALRQHLQKKRAAIEMEHKRDEHPKDQRDTAATAPVIETEAAAAERKKRRLEEEEREAEKELNRAAHQADAAAAAMGMGMGMGITAMTAEKTLDSEDTDNNNNNNNNSSSGLVSVSPLKATSADPSSSASGVSAAAGSSSSTAGGGSSWDGFHVAALDDDDLYADLTSSSSSTRRHGGHHHHLPYDNSSGAFLSTRLPPPPPFQPPQYGSGPLGRAGRGGARAGGPFSSYPPRRGGFRGGPGPAPGAYHQPPSMAIESGQMPLPMPMTTPIPHHHHHHHHQSYYPPPSSSSGGPSY